MNEPISKRRENESTRPQIVAVLEALTSIFERARPPLSLAPPEALDEHRGVHLVRVEVPGRQHRVLVQLASAGEIRRVDALARALRERQKGVAPSRRPTVALLAAPNITAAAQQRCIELDLGYLDTAASSYHVWLSPYHFDRVAPPIAGRSGRKPGPLFSQLRAQAIRVLLCHPYRTWHQREIAAAARLSVGTIHALVRRLESERHLSREGKGKTQTIHLIRPESLLDEWAQWWQDQRQTRYAFHSEHPSAYARMSALYAATSQIGFSFEASDRTNPEQNLSPLVFTGLAGASLVAPYADFEVVTAYVSRDISGLARKAGLNYVETAPNVLLLAAPDRGIFYDTRWINGYPVACLPQLYADLLAIGARAAGEVAPLVRDRILRKNDGRITDLSL